MGQVLIAVEACGICGADRGDIENADPAANRVPGHEVVSRIIAFGAHAYVDTDRQNASEVLTGVRPRIETMPLERAEEAYRKMRSVDVKFRMVLTMGDGSDADQ